MSEECVIIETTVGALQDAQTLARALIDMRLVACCHLFSITSCYRWQGNVEEGEEVTIRCKTIMKRVEGVIEYLKANHPYKVPEIIVIKVESRNQEYSNWMKESVEGVRE